MPGPEFPILGTESLAVELANTLYGSGNEQIDFLRTVRWINEWFTLVSAEHGVTAPAAMGRDAERVRMLRDCVHSLLSAAIDERRPDEVPVERVNGFAAAPTHSRLDWTGAGRPVSRWRDTTQYCGARPDRHLLHRVADRVRGGESTAMPAPAAR